ncbi:hypothetical protein SORBI_3009G221000 [Sorghum bicolor]|uniref:NB-ARC domain-containing protein n=1 Tax=Sorghum bicolor TaxID=4558 RepID=A0A1B6P9U3_SORBI|nr:hypothetical protein SORBI_3009G221000 [Sorghum bicolor]
MEAAEATAVEGAILWQAQTILDSLRPTGELDAWLHGVGLAGGIGELKSEVERMETVVNGVKGRAVGNKPLARSLARVKELMYDADDVVDELDYCRLQQQVEGVMVAPSTEPEGMVVGDGAEQADASTNTVVMLAPAIEPEGMVGDGAEHADPSASTADISANNGRKNRSKERDYFHITPAVNGQPGRAKCIDCGTQVIFSHGTSVLRKHRNSASCKKKRAAIEEVPNCPSAGDSIQNGATISTYDLEGRKRMRIEYSVSTTTHLWGKADFFIRIQEIALELRSIRGDVIEYLKDSVARSDQYQSNTTSDARVRTSGSLLGRVYGRYIEKQRIMSVIEAMSDNITVLAIAGIVGVGKTTLAKLVYNDRFVKKQFERIWVWVSNIFDEVRVTREILDVVTMASHEGSCKKESYEGVSNYSKLLEVLKKHMPCLSKKFLLVLDDVCDCMDHSQWDDLLDALGSSCINGNVIIVTSRNLSVAKRLGTVKPVEVRALENDDFLQFFRACAFGDNNYKEHLDTSQQICEKLEGNPLAAKSAVEMLREHPTLDHWKNIIKNGIWESMQLRGGIVTVLTNIYYHLPYHLQQCFLVCSIFPNDHQFHIDGLISMWTSSGFVKSIEVGRDYLNALVNLCFFEQVGTEDDSEDDSEQCYVMCGMMHEFARLISRTEFATIDGFECKVLPTVRHLSIQIETNLEYHIDECEILIHNVKFEEKLQSIASSLRRLRTVILIGDDSLFVLKSFHTFISNLVNCTHLRYLKLGKKLINEYLPISLSKLYHLEILDAGCRAIVNDLISMRHLVLTKGACSPSSIARYASLQTIHIEDCKGWEVLTSLESLSSLTKLKLRNMVEVTELLIPSLEELVLTDMPKLYRCFINSVEDLNSSLRILKITSCQVLMSFPLFERCENFEIEQKSWLPNVSELTVYGCPHLVVSNPVPPSSNFCKFFIANILTLPTMEGSSNGEMKIARHLVLSRFKELSLDDKFLSFHNLKTITQLQIVGGIMSVLSMSPKGLMQLVSLKRLEIYNCATIFSSDVPSPQAHEDMAATVFDALPSLECLKIMYCGITGEWLSVMLQHVRALEELRLDDCKKIPGLMIDGEDNSFSNLTLAPRASSNGNPDSASKRSCSELLRIPSNLFPSLKKMSIKYCELIKFQRNKEGFSEFTSLEELNIYGCHELIPSSVHGDEIDEQENGRWLLPCSLSVLDIRGVSLGTLQPCFPGDLTRLTVLEVSGINALKSLQLHSCTALEKLTIRYCESLDALEGFQSLCSLRYLEVYKCPGLPQCLKSLSTQGYELCPRLESLRIDDPSLLTTPFCKHLTSLQCLQLDHRYTNIDVTGLTYASKRQRFSSSRPCKSSDLKVAANSRIFPWVCIAPSLSQATADLLLQEYLKAATEGPPTIAGRTGGQLVQRGANRAVQNASNKQAKGNNRLEICELITGWLV